MPPPAGKFAKQGSVRALTRGLAILRHVNAMGEARPGEIARALNIPRPTVYRLLETLEEAGYVAFSASSNLVRVTRLAAALGDGYALRSELCQAAAPLFAEYGARLVWPIDLSVYENTAMVILETTHGRSPLSIDRAMIGYRLPMLRTSAGRAYLSFCGEEERTLILDHLQRLGDTADLPFLDPLWFNRMADETRAHGFAIRDAGEFRPQTASIAAPVQSGGMMIGCISMIWIRSAMDTSKAIGSHAKPLCELAAKIGAAIEDRNCTPDIS
jgi:IclR family mhp operon transcriptional activator